MNLISKAFMLLIVVIYSESGKIEKMNNKDPKWEADNVYDDTINGNSLHDDALDEMDIENSASQGTIADRLKRLPAKVLISLFNSGHELKSGMGKIFNERKVSEGAKQSFEAILGLFKDGYINAKDLAFG